MTDDASTDQPAAEIAPTTISHGPGDGAVSAEKHGMFGVAGSGDTSGFGGLVRDKWVAPAAARPYGSYFDELVDNLQIVYPEFDAAVTKIVVDRDELTLEIKREHLLGIAGALRNDQSLRFELLSSVSGVDYFDANQPESARLHSVYHLTSMTYRRRIRLEVALTVSDPHVPSLTKLYPTADWQERETWDLFGIIYDGHPALTRILMPDDWDGHPQRKDYPLGGIHVQYKGATIPPPDERRVYK
ncbi:NADH-quinone oxidoreductase subunit C [Jatrophihabitans sp.]|uniref:NADH-quinone oxidoreductase subunit C n=1 Tax=Jatrophihabitans sp. TaxID=1932789 RepID=UPI0030C72C44|nr:nuoC [Jatrophihabitans sp.]